MRKLAWRNKDILHFNLINHLSTCVAAPRREASSAPDPPAELLRQNADLTRPFYVPCVERRTRRASASAQSLHLSDIRTFAVIPAARTGREPNKLLWGLHHGKGLKRLMGRHMEFVVKFGTFYKKKREYVGLFKKIPSAWSHMSGEQGRESDKDVPLEQHHECGETKGKKICSGSLTSLQFTWDVD